MKISFLNHIGVKLKLYQQFLSIVFFLNHTTPHSWTEELIQTHLIICLYIFNHHSLRTFFHKLYRKCHASGQENTHKRTHTHANRNTHAFIYRRHTDTSIWAQDPFSSSIFYKTVICQRLRERRDETFGIMVQRKCGIQMGKWFINKVMCVRCIVVWLVMRLFLRLRSTRVYLAIKSISYYASFFLRFFFLFKFCKYCDGK